MRRSKPPRQGIPAESGVDLGCPQVKSRTCCTTAVKNFISTQFKNRILAQSSTSHRAFLILRP